MDEGTNSKSYEYFVPIDDIRPIKSLTVICPQHDEPDFDAKAFESNLIDMEKAYYDDIVIRRREAGGAYITFLSPGFDLKKLAKLINQQEYKNVTAAIRKTSLVLVTLTKREWAMTTSVC